MLWKILETEPGTPVTVDLHTRQGRCQEFVFAVGVDDYTRYRLLEGLDDVDITLQSSEAIDAFEAARESWRPTTLPVLS